MGGGYPRTHPTLHKFSILLICSGFGLRGRQGCTNVPVWGLGHVRTCVLVSVSSHCEQKSVLLRGGERCGKAALN